MKAEIKSGSVFGRWTVINTSRSDHHGHQFHQCRCQCGAEKEVRADALAGGMSMSCGCASAKAKMIDMTGAKYGSVTGVARTGSSSSGDARWEFVCDCGKHFEASGYSVRSGKVTTCPDCSSKRTSEAHIKHAMSASPEFAIWVGMLTRCYNKNSMSFANYGGRGISVCDEWRESFISFYNDMGDRPSPAHSLDRIDNNGNYDPSNCRWATEIEQANNKRNNIVVEINGKKKTVSEVARENQVNVSGVRARAKRGITGDALLRRDCKHLTHNGETKSIAEWASKTGINATTISMRVSRYGWSADRALTTGARL